MRRPPPPCPLGDDDRRAPLIRNISAFELSVDRGYSEYQVYGIRKRKFQVEKLFDPLLSAYWRLGRQATLRGDPNNQI
jgi:hypothetical protein